MKKRYIILILAFILLLGFFFRFYKLSSIPPGLYPDEAINGNDAWHALQNKNFQFFYPENNGREGLFINLISLSFALLKPSIFSLKIISAIFGLLTVLGIYLLSQEIFFFSKFTKLEKDAISLLSAFFLSISFWHTNFSRIAFRGILEPFILVFSIYFLFLSFRKRRFIYAVFSGFLFGLGFYTYTAFRLAVILLFFLLILWWFIYKKENKNKLFLKISLLILFVIFITALPIGFYFLQHPQYFISRATGVSIFKQSSPGKAFVISLIKHLGMFNIKGDPNPRHNIPSSPMLFWPVGILFLTGLFYSFWKSTTAIKNKNYILLLIYGTLISWWFVLLLPGILTFEGIPHSLRCIGAIPPTFIFASLGAVIIWRYFRKKIILKNNFSRTLLVIVLIILGSSFVYAQYFRYFIKWGNNPETAGAFTKNWVMVGQFVNSLPENYQKYIIVNASGVLVSCPLASSTQTNSNQVYPKGIPMPTQTPMFIEITKYGRVKSEYLLPKDIDKIKIKKGVIIPLNPDEALLKRLKEKFLSGEIIENKYFSFLLLKNK